MFIRNIWNAAEISRASKTTLFQKDANAYKYVMIQNSFHNSRRTIKQQSLKPDPLEHIQFDSGPLHAKLLFKPFLFTVGMSALSLAGCVIWEYENLRSHATYLLQKPSAWLNSQQKKIFPKKELGGNPIKKWWNSLKTNEKVFYSILAANLLVFGAWRLRPFQPVMVKYFCSNPAGKATCSPMILSTFSHYSTLHLAANMYVLYSFMPAAIATLGKEQFIAMYLSAGVFSSFASFFYKVLLQQPGLSLGASGAIMAVLAYVCMQYPDTKLSIIFLPTYTFAAAHAIKVIMTVDLAGVLLGWKFFDHAAHLGGALFGIAWCHWGGTHIWAHRDKFLQYYHSVRKNDR